MFAFLRDRGPRAAMTSAATASRMPGRARRSLIGLVTALGLVAASTGAASATTYGGYSGDFVSGILVCSPGYVGLTLPSSVQIAGDRGNIIGESQNVWTTSMLYRWNGSSWQSASGWSSWQYGNLNDSMSSFILWYDGSSIADSGPLWTNLSPGYYATYTWMYFGERPGVVGAGWAYSTSYDSLNPYCQV